MENLEKWLGGHQNLRPVHFALSLRVTLAALLAAEVEARSPRQKSARQRRPAVRASALHCISRSSRCSRTPSISSAWWTSGGPQSAPPAGLYFRPVDPRHGTDAWSGATRTLLDGVPTRAGWVDYLQMLGGFGCLGALGAIVFWATLKITGDLRLQ